MPTLPPWLMPALAQLLERRGHAFLILGPSGLGQRELALALAQAWLCDAPTADGACGACPSCHAIEVRAHADLAVLMPETDLLALGWPLPEKAQADIDEKRRKPSAEIRVEVLRDAIEFSQRTSARGRGKVVLIDPADRMNEIAANALLKTLEEPAGETRFVLATQAAHRLPATIRSRCQSVSLAWPSSAEVLPWLERQGVAAEDARAFLRLAGGLPFEALRLAQGDRSAAQWAAMPAALARGDASALSGLTLAQSISFLQKLSVDLMTRRLGGQPRFFEPQDLPVVRAEVDSAAALAALSAWAKALLRAAETADHPFQPALALEALAAQAHKVLRMA